MPPTSTEKVLQASSVRIGRTLVAPIQLQLSASDVVTVRYKTLYTGTVPQIDISYRLLTPDGELVDGNNTVQIVNDGLFHSSTFQLRDGFLLALTASTTIGNQLGELFVQAFVTRLTRFGPLDSLAQNLVVLPMLQGFVTPTQFLAWPNSLFESGSAAAWYPKRYRPSPIPWPVSTDWNFTVPSATNWRIVSISCQLVTSAVAGNRQVLLAFSDPGISIFPWVSARGPAQAPGTSVRYTWAVGMTRNDALASDTWVAELPDGLELFGAVDTVRVLTNGLAAGDQWNQIEFQVLERII